MRPSDKSTDWTYMDKNKTKRGENGFQVVKNRINGYKKTKEEAEAPSLYLNLKKKWILFFHLRHHLAHFAASHHLHHFASLVKLFQQAVYFLDGCSATFGDTGTA